jgi:hypothetical protein
MKGGSFQMCKVIVELAKTLVEKELMVGISKENKEGEEENNG